MSTESETVLVMEDDASIRSFVALALRDAGFRVLDTADGRDGLHLARTCLPRVVLLDLRMPNGDGIEFIESSRADPPPHPPIVVMTAAGQLELTSVRDMVDAVLPKPSDLDDLLSVVRFYFGALAPE